jgi:Flp pilus assembly protein TadG
MKNSKHTLGGRNSERGAIAILIAFMWTTLFGLAAFAVDVGYLYTRQRGIQSVADAAVVAGMPAIEAGSVQTARDRASAVADLNGYTGGNATITPTGSSLRVELRRQHPTFFGSILGLSARTLTAQSEGRLTTAAAPVIHSHAGCGSSFGLTFVGNARVNVTGSVQSNGTMDLDVSMPGSTISGQARVACPGQPTVDAMFTPPSVFNGGPYADPLAGLTPASFTSLCTNGNLTGTAPTINPLCGAGPGGCDLVPPGIYCNMGNISVTSSCAAQRLCAPNATFVSATGQIQFGANNGISLGPPHANSLQNVVVITGNGGNPAVHLGAANTYSLTGVIYAPLGVIMCNGGGVGPNTLTGGMIGSEIFMAMPPNAVWNFTGGSSTPSGAWRLYQ